MSQDKHTERQNSAPYAAEDAALAMMESAARRQKIRQQQETKKARGFFARVLAIFDGR